MTLNHFKTLQRNMVLFFPLLLFIGACAVPMISEIQNRELIDAVKREQVERVRVLLNAGFDSECCDANGQSVLLHAKKTGNEQIISDLNKATTERRKIFVDFVQENYRLPCAIDQFLSAKKVLHVPMQNRKSVDVAKMEQGGRVHVLLDSGVASEKGRVLLAERELFMRLKQLFLSKRS